MIKTSSPQSSTTENTNVSTVNKNKTNKNQQKQSKVVQDVPKIKLVDIKMSITYPLQILKITNFEEIGLSQELLKNMHHIGIYYPTRLQQVLLPTAMANPPQDIALQTYAHLAKSVALVLIMFKRLESFAHCNYPCILYFCATEERSVKTEQVAKKLCPQLRIHSTLTGVNWVKGIKFPYQIIIGTPEAINVLRIFNAFDMDKIVLFIVDEGENKSLLCRVHRYFSKSKCQKITLSSFYTNIMIKKAKELSPNAIFLRCVEEM